MSSADIWSLLGLVSCCLPHPCALGSGQARSNKIAAMVFFQSEQNLYILSFVNIEWQVAEDRNERLHLLQYAPAESELQQRQAHYFRKAVQNKRS